MLRALGIPSRIAVGFLTENRADKNKCWYWYYAKQAHAWVQVYFPGLGWLDFDTTVGNNEARESPTPDGTPPMQPPRAWLAADGLVEDVDTLHKTMRLAVKQFVFHDREFKVTVPLSIVLDMKVAVVYRDSLTIPIANVMRGEEGTAVSYAEAFKNIEPTPADNATSISRRFPSPAPVDEVYLKSRETEQPKEAKKPAAQAPKDTLRTLLIKAGVITTLLLFLALVAGRLVFAYLMLRYKYAPVAKDKAWWAFLAATYYLHMSGLPRSGLTPLQYARQVIDPQLGTQLAAFMNVYLKQKYAGQPLNEREQQIVLQFLAPFLVKVRAGIPFKKRFAGFANPVRSLMYFVVKDDELMDDQE